MNGTKSWAAHGSDRNRQRIADEKLGTPTEPPSMKMGSPEPIRVDWCRRAKFKVIGYRGSSP